MKVAIVETNKLHLDGVYNNYDIKSYSVDSTLSAILFDDIDPPHTIEILTEDEFDSLLLTPDWNHSLTQDGL